MISAPRLRQYIASTGATPEIALQEVVLTYVLAALYEQPFAEQLAFKGGTALRKLLYGAEGRFSVDLDFLGAATIECSRSPAISTGSTSMA
jgi:predicted nucleotidyltransferase component of viral defense system